jgi:hypothetical protein
MTISRTVCLAVALLLAVTGVWADAQASAPTTPSNPTTTSSQGSFSYPKTLIWAVAQFQGEGEWAVRLPLLLIRGWDTLPDHQLSASEQAALKTLWKDDALRSLDRQGSSLRLSLDKKKISGTLSITEPDSTAKSLADLGKKAAQTQGTPDPDTDPPKTLPWKPAWEKDQTNRPWVALDAHDLLTKSKAHYAFTGSVRTVGNYLDVSIQLYSALEEKVIVSWEGRFAPEEATDKMEEASQQFHGALLGRAWSGLAVDSDVAGTRIKVADHWHALPWQTDDLKPGTAILTIEKPGRAPETKTVDLIESSRQKIFLPAGPSPVRRLVLETDPPGALLYLDSTYLGPSPQTIDQPLAVSRVRAESAGWATLAWEIGPETGSPSRRTLSRPEPLPSVPDAKDKFYFSLALFSISLTSTAFAGAWTTEQVELTNAYAAAGDQTGYDLAYSRYQMVSTGYAVGVVLTSGLFVWMMFELGDYLAAAQAGLP